MLKRKDVSCCIHFFKEFFKEYIGELLKALHAILCPELMFSFFILVGKPAEVSLLEPYNIVLRCGPAGFGLEADLDIFAGQFDRPISDSYVVSVEPVLS